jgi:hypothetical protein
MKRYDLVGEIRCGEAWQDMKACAYGEWVRFEDVEALLASQPAPATNSGRDALITEAVEAWREWGNTPDQFPSERLIDAMHNLSEHEAQ